MRKLLLTTVGVTALAVSANATDFTLSGTGKIKIDDDGNTSVSLTTSVGVSKTFDNGMVASYTHNLNSAASEMKITSDAIAITFGDIDQNAQAPGLGGDAAASDIASEGINEALGTPGENSGAISMGVTLAGVSIGAATNNNGDTQFGASMTTDMAGMAIKIGGDVHSDADNATADQTAMGISATLGNLVMVASSISVSDANDTTDVMSYSAAYTMGSLVLGFQGNDAEASSYSATYTIVPGMQFELGSKDDGTVSTSSGELQLTF
jgi:hypothetical protein